MAAYKLEAGLLKPVSLFLHSHSYTAQVAELPFFEYRVDLFGYSPYLGATLAVELKLSKWRRAFEQALVYQICADYSVVALPRAAAERVDRAMLSMYGVGLFSVDQDGGCEVLLAPVRSTATSSLYRDDVVAWLTGSGGT